jgi:hypothetical protein
MLEAIVTSEQQLGLMVVLLTAPSPRKVNGYDGVDSSNQKPNDFVE